MASWGSFGDLGLAEASSTWGGVAIAVSRRLTHLANRVQAVGFRCGRILQLDDFCSCGMRVLCMWILCVRVDPAWTIAALGGGICCDSPSLRVSCSAMPSWRRFQFACSLTFLLFCRRRLAAARGWHARRGSRDSSGIHAGAPPIQLDPPPLSSRTHARMARRASTALTSRSARRRSRCVLTTRVTISPCSCASPWLTARTPASSQALIVVSWTRRTTASSRIVLALCHSVRMWSRLRLNSMRRSGVLEAWLGRPSSGHLLWLGRRAPATGQGWQCAGGAIG